jgi:hypothetical protein
MNGKQTVCNALDLARKLLTSWTLTSAELEERWVQLLPIHLTNKYLILLRVRRDR